MGDATVGAHCRAARSYGDWSHSDAVHELSHRLRPQSAPAHKQHHHLDSCQCVGICHIAVYLHLPQPHFAPRGTCHSLWHHPRRRRRCRLVGCMAHARHSCRLALCACLPEISLYRDSGKLCGRDSACTHREDAKRPRRHSTHKGMGNGCHHTGDSGGELSVPLLPLAQPQPCSQCGTAHRRICSDSPWRRLLRPVARAVHCGSTDDAAWTGI